MNAHAESMLTQFTTQPEGTILILISCEQSHIPKIPSGRNFFFVGANKIAMVSRNTLRWIGIRNLKYFCSSALAILSIQVDGHNWEGMYMNQIRATWRVILF